MPDTSEGTVSQVYDDSGAVTLAEDGQRYGKSKQAKDPTPKVGDKVRLTYTVWEKTGKPYWSACKVLDYAPTAPASPGSPAHRDVSISRQVAVKASLDFLRLRFENQARAEAIVEPVDMDALLTNADIIFGWIAERPGEPDEEP